MDIITIKIPIIGEFELLIIKFGIRRSKDTKLRFDLYSNGIIKTIKVWMFRNPLNLLTSPNDSKSKFEKLYIEIIMVFKKVLRNKIKIILLKIIFSCIIINKKFENIIINKKYNKTGADLAGRIEL